MKIPKGSIIVPFCDLYLGSYKGIPKKKELLWSLWVCTHITFEGVFSDYPKPESSIV